MDKLKVEVNAARRKVNYVIDFTRCAWILSMGAAVAGFLYGRYDMAVLAAATWVLTVTPAGMAGRAANHLECVAQALEPECAQVVELQDGDRPSWSAQEENI